jgi:hypothetical protein
MSRPGEAYPLLRVALRLFPPPEFDPWAMLELHHKQNDVETILGSGVYRVYNDQGILQEGKQLVGGFDVWGTDVWGCRSSSSNDKKLLLLPLQVAVQPRLKNVGDVRLLPVSIKAFC